MYFIGSHEGDFSVKTNNVQPGGMTAAAAAAAGTAAAIVQGQSNMPNHYHRGTRREEPTREANVTQ